MGCVVRCEIYDNASTDISPSSPHSARRGAIRTQVPVKVPTPSTSSSSSVRIGKSRTPPPGPRARAGPAGMRRNPGGNAPCGRAAAPPRSTGRPGHDLRARRRPRAPAPPRRRTAGGAGWQHPQSLRSAKSAKGRGGPAARRPGGLKLSLAVSATHVRSGPESRLCYCARPGRRERSWAVRRLTRHPGLAASTIRMGRTDTRASCKRSARSPRTSQRCRRSALSIPACCGNAPEAHLSVSPTALVLARAYPSGSGCSSGGFTNGDVCSQPYTSDPTCTSSELLLAPTHGRVIHLDLT